MSERKVDLAGSLTLANLSVLYLYVFYMPREKRNNNC